MHLLNPGNLVLGTGPWWSSAVVEGLGLRCLVIAGVGAVVLSILLRALWNGSRPAAVREATTAARVVAAWRQFRGSFRGLRGESGTATVEFVLVFPAALWICLILLQTVFVFTGNLFVNYAAFAATRVAIVQAPVGQLGGGGALDYDGEGPAAAAFEAVERAAAYAMVPVAGKGNAGSDGDAGGESGESGPAGRFVEGLKAYYGEDAAAPAWVTRLAGPRMRYALDNTEVTLYETRVADNGVPDLVPIAKTPGPDGGFTGSVSFGPKDPVTVGVTHNLALTIPYASFVFSEKTRDAQGEAVSRTQPIDGGSIPYTTVFATSTMTLEGYRRDLPPLPAVEREN